jgi:hypothetical protein
MGTTLTGTTPQDTYDSLIKVTDNGPLSGSLKTLTDGLGNDSALALSTGAASITGTLAVTGNATFDTNTLFVDAASNEVGIGTVSPSYKLHVYNPVGTNVASTLLLENAFVGQSATARYKTTVGEFEVGNAISVTANSFEVYDRTNSASRLFISNAGNVGIGTDAPQQKLQIGGTGGVLASTAAISFTDANSGSSRNWAIANGASASGIDQIGALTISRSNAFNGDALTAGTEIARFSANGLSFNGDTAAANALDDYEEGTWTMGVSFGGASVGVTYSTNTGTYTKVGRQVTVNGYLALTSKGSSTGNALITGLPFTVGNTNSNYAAASIHFYSISFANQMFARVNKNSTDILLAESTEAGVFSEITDTNFANDSEVMVLATYFV